MEYRKNRGVWGKITGYRKNHGVWGKITGYQGKIMEFKEKSNCIKDSVYIDDGYSGTNYDRPAFRQLIKDIQGGEMSTFITKDLSRLGRNYLETGTYIEVFFPNHSWFSETRRADPLRKCL